MNSQPVSPVPPPRPTPPRARPTPPPRPTLPLRAQPTPDRHREN